MVCITINCMNDETIVIDDSVYKHMETVVNMVNDVIDINNGDTNIDITFKNVDKKSIKIISDVLKCIENTQPYNFHCKDEYFNTLKVANILDCKIVYTYLIDGIVNCIKHYNVDEIRYIFGEDREWSDDEYNKILNDDSWCFRIPEITNPLLQKIHNCI